MTKVYQINTDFVDAILLRAKDGVYRSQIDSMRSRFKVKLPEVYAHISAARKRGLVVDNTKSSLTNAYYTLST